jgi:hypothetical protein
MTTTNSPRAIASIADGMESKVNGEGGLVGGLDTGVGADMARELGGGGEGSELLEREVVGEEWLAND